MRNSVTRFIVSLLFSSLIVCIGCNSNAELDEIVSGQTETSREASGLTDSPNPLLQNANSAIQYALQLMVAETQSATGLRVNGVARFYESTTPLLTAPILRAKQLPDICEIDGLGDQFTFELIDVPIDHLIEAHAGEILQVNRITAGETVELRSEAGSFISLHLDSNLADAQYSIPLTTEVNSVPPQNMILDIPGAQFPASQFSWVKPEALGQDFKNKISNLLANPVLEWEGRDTTVDRTLDASLEQESRVLFWAGQINELTGSFAAYQCDVRDDGNFTIPENIQQLYADGFDATFISVARYTRRVQVVDDIAVVSVYLEKF